MKIKYKFLIIFLFICNTIFAQETLSKYNTSWTSVLPGSVICEPVATSYGFCLATDARNLMGFSSSGVLLWEKNIGRVRNISLTVLKGDFILFHDISNNVYKLFNPSGTEIWSQTIDFVPFSKPFAGRDGRFFIYGENKILCLGINGKIRWQLETDYQKELSMQELPDGSLIIFLRDLNGCTQGLRISPFGKQLEKIIFSGSIKSTNTCNDGVLLTFENGNSGLFALSNGFAKSRWVTNVKVENPVFVVSSDKNDYRLLSLSKSQITIYKLNNENGVVESYKTITGIDGTSLLQTVYSDSGLFLADSYNAFLIDSDFKELWSAKIPETVRNKTINEMVYLDDDYLVFCNKNWSMSAYHTNQTTKSNVSKNIQNPHSDYSSFAPLNLDVINYYTADAFFSQIKDDSITEHLFEGFYGSEEQQWLTQILSIAKLYAIEAGSQSFGTRPERSIFQTDSAGFETILLQLSLLCTDQSQNAAAAIISESSDKTFCRTLLSNLTGYDPDGKLLKALERNALRAGTKDSAYINSLCDCVYSICLFMGRPAYNKKGKELLKKFIGLEYSSVTRNYARETLKKIIALEL